MPAAPITIVKLGGSMMSSRHLTTWLDALAGCGGRTVVVPGGGPFADTVRATQGILEFTEDAAHAMALLAMEQFGRALVSLRPGFRIAGSVSAIEAALLSGAVPVWSPVTMVLVASGVPASWDVTSDSLAVWLAAQLGSDRVLLVKRNELATLSAQPGALAHLGVVDRAFPRFLQTWPVDTAIVSADSPVETAAAIRQHRRCGVPLVLPRHARASAGA